MQTECIAKVRRQKKTKNKIYSDTAFSSVVEVGDEKNDIDTIISANSNDGGHHVFVVEKSSVRKNKIFRNRVHLIGKWRKNQKILFLPYFFKFSSKNIHWNIEKSPTNKKYSRVH